MGNKKRIWAWLPPSLHTVFSLKCREEDLSESELVGKALIAYLTKDVTDESLLIAKLTALEKQMRCLDKKVDVGQKLDLEWYQHYFMFTPDIGETERLIKHKQALDKTLRFLTAFRKHCKGMPAFLESVLGEMLEGESG